VVRGAILAHYRTLGGPAALGFPTGDDSPSAGGGYMTAFQGGEVHWSPATGPHALRGAILTKWKALGGGASVLGFPKTDDGPAPGGRGRFAEFQGGSVYWVTGAANAYVVRTAVDELYQAADGTTGGYGYPVSDTYPVPGGYRVDFETGQITAPVS
jgi:uncharacterized protein with LGFP repeats